MRRHYLALGRDVLSYGVMAGLSGLTGILLLPIFTRVFETAEYGALDILVTLSALLGVLSRLGLPRAYSRYFHEREPHERRVLMTTLLLVTLAAGAFLMLLAWLASDAIAGQLLGDPGGGTLVVIAVLAAVLDALGGLPLMALRMERRIVAFNVLNLVKALLYAGSALFFVLALEAGVAGVLWGSVLGALGQLVGGLLAHRGGLALAVSGAELRRSLRFSLPIVPSVLVGWVNRQADRFILLAFVGLAGVGVYGAAARVGNVVLLLTTFFRQAWQPYAMSLLKEPAEIRDVFFQRILNLYLVAFAVGSVAVVAVAKEVFSLFFGADFLPGYVVLPWIVGAGVLHVAGDIVVMGVLISERTHPISVAAWTGACVNVALAVVLVPQLGIPGAAVGLFAAELLYVALLWRASVRLTGAGLGARRLFPLLGYYVAASLALLELSARETEPMETLPWRLAVVVAFAAAALLHCADPVVRRSLRSAGRTLRAPSMRERAQEKEAP